MFNFGEGLISMVCFPKLFCSCLKQQKLIATSTSTSTLPTQPSVPPGSVNEYQLRLRRKRQVGFIPLADERGGVQVKL